MEAEDELPPFVVTPDVKTGVFFGIGKRGGAGNAEGVLCRGANGGIDFVLETPTPTAPENPVWDVIDRILFF